MLMGFAVLKGVEICYVTWAMGKGRHSSPNPVIRHLIVNSDFGAAMLSVLIIFLHFHRQRPPPTPPLINPLGFKEPELFEA